MAGCGKSPVLNARVNVDWLTLDPESLSIFFPRLYNGILCNVFNEKVSMGPSLNQSSVVSLLLPVKLRNLSLGQIDLSSGQAYHSLRIDSACVGINGKRAVCDLVEHTKRILVNFQVSSLNFQQFRLTAACCCHYMFWWTATVL